MTAEIYTAKNGSKQFRPVLTEAEYRSQSEEYAGFCLGCGETADGVEPDLCRAVCPGCGQPKVYGLQELLFMDLVVFKDEEPERP
jgi:hypothetical protein